MKKEQIHITLPLGEFKKYSQKCRERLTTASNEIGKFIRKEMEKLNND